jgi:hypothetical protein
MNTMTTRCTDCATEFTDEQVKGATCCPACGTKGLPCSISQDTTININWHELRILTIWATNWAENKCDEGGKKTLRSIIQRLQSQRKEGWTALTILDEIKELPEALKKEGIEVGNVELYQGKDQVYPPLPRVVHAEEQS